MEQFNPSLRNFIAMGKNYEKALAGEAWAPVWRVDGAWVQMLASVPVVTGWP